ncbi:unnamed protein product [Didymodactylos carnosus]|uniref:Uncharacterized protein n=1 Tax=Didymodactylos carnosus TaxID=1234261 RepID=A0A813X875_9BILA|nr:unnamed protein product [Didymodactylos carnosus]CAF1023012.1 unnamed protein product [Didymodactylos carnosus]CAF3653728.1 unnamed protein product [Didymodactylos carnosus]CAF3791519.1 unnamed protein product [Didymodactylos carnosus]
MATSRAQSKQSRPAQKKVKDPRADKLPASVLEIVPGKFSENDWYNLIENDETEDFIADIIDDIWNQTSKQIEKIYISKQLLPYTTVMVKNALSNWAFLERDEPQPTQGTFWTEDDEPIPSNMDNFGEGVVPACREETQILPSEGEIPHIHSDHASVSSGSSSLSGAKQQQIIPKKQRNETLAYEHENTENKLIPNDSILAEHTTFDPSELNRIEPAAKYIADEVEQQSDQQTDKRPYNHDILVIQTPKLEPLAELFFPPTDSKPPNDVKKRKQSRQTKRSLTLLTVDSQSVTTKSSYTGLKKTDDVRSRLFDDQHIEELINKAPVAAHSILKSILSRPQGYRELELDEFGNVATIMKLDPDKLPPKSIRVKCDVIKPRKIVIDTRPALNVQRESKKERSQDGFQSIKLVVPEQSTDVGDLIQPVPGVLYEDRRLKKGDPRRYQTGLSKYFGFHDDKRPLRPIANHNDIVLTAKQILRDDNSDEDNVEQQSKVQSFRTLNRIPPIISSPTASSA